MRRRSRPFFFAVVVLLHAGPTGAIAAPHGTNARADSLRYEVQATKYLMGTQVDATVMHSDVLEAQRALVGAFKEMERIESVLSSQRDTSEVSKVNREAADGPVRVSLETFDILSRAKVYSERFGGLFDVTVGSLTELWGFSGPGEPAIPADDALAQARASVGDDYLVLNAADTTVFFLRPGLKIDLGGIAKGYAIDRAAGYLKAQGIQNFVINAGGDLYISGDKLPGVPWVVGIKHPRRTDELLATMKAEDLAVVTSGDYERFFEQDGRRYHHIIDPRTGYPATASRSVTVVGKSAEEADVLATWLFILGAEQAPALPPGRDVLRVASDGTVHYDSTAWKAYDLQLIQPTR